MASILNDYLKGREYYIFPLNILDKKVISKVIEIINLFRDKEIIISTRDLEEFLFYKIISLLLLKPLSYKVYISYDNKKEISSRKIRKAIREGRYNDIRENLVKDLDEKTISYIKYLNDKEYNLNFILKYVFYNKY